MFTANLEKIRVNIADHSGNARPERRNLERTGLIVEDSLLGTVRGYRI